MKGHVSSMPLFDGAAERSRPAVPLNPTVEEWDAPRLSAAQKRLLRVLCDRQWHTSGELAHVVGYRFSARMEELKKAGWPWVKEHVSGGTWRYRLLERGEQSREVQT